MLPVKTTCSVHARFWIISILLSATVFWAARSAEANNGPASVPQAVLSAKWVYVENLTTDAQIQTEIYTELMKWGRFQIAESAQKADLILRISNGNIVRFVAGDAANAPVAETKAASPAADDTVPPGSTRLTLLDPKTGSSLWNSQKKTSGAPAGWHLLDSLRYAIEKSSKAK